MIFFQLRNIGYEISNNGYYDRLGYKISHNDILFLSLDDFHSVISQIISQADLRGHVCLQAHMLFTSLSFADMPFTKL